MTGALVSANRKRINSVIKFQILFICLIKFMTKALGIIIFDLLKLFVTNPWKDSKNTIYTYSIHDIHIDGSKIVQVSQGMEKNLQPLIIYPANLFAQIFNFVQNELIRLL